jgi:hypothetical protein
MSRISAFHNVNVKEQNMDTPTINHRRDRQHTRRVLAEIRSRGRHLTPSNSFWESDFIDRPHRLAANDNHKDVFPVAVAKERQ